VKKGDELIWQSRLFIGGVEYEPLSYTPTLLETDPINSNYTWNVLEWDYGVCKRRLRVIEGRLRSWWTFSEPPGGNISIVHNKEGKGELKLGFAHGASGTPIAILVDDDIEVVTVESFSKATFPLIVGDSATFYPDADPETSSVDGYVLHYKSTGTSLSVLRSGGGTGAADDISEPIQIAGIYYTSAYGYIGLYRGVFLFDTSTLNGASVDATTLSLFITSQGSTTGFPYRKFGIYSSNPANNTYLTASDYYYATHFGSTAFAVRDSFSIPYYNDFSLDANGIANINATGISKFGVREVYYDQQAHDPPSPAEYGPLLKGYYSEKGSGYKPKLTITYTPSGWPHRISGIEPAKVMGIDKSNIKSILGVE